MLRQKSKEVVHHNRVHDEVLQDQNVLYTGSGSGNEKLPDQLKSLLRKYKRASKRYVRALQKELDAATITQLESRFRLARARFRTARKVWDQKRKQRRFAHIADALLQHDTRTVWGRLRSTTDQTARGNALPPVRNKDGELKVSGADIMYEMTSYYRELAQDNPDNISTDEARWAEMDLGEDLPDLGGINQALAWPEVLLAIRRMNRNTAPGKDGVHINVLKSMVVEECMAELVRQNPDFARADKVMVNLPKDELPIHPLTPMGRAFWTLMNRVWEGGAFPAIWNEVWVCSLLKPGDPDPEILSNYRGISLISVSQKVLMQVMTEHLQEAAERENLIAPEQSGFRRREEAIAQFIVLSEVVRRRHLQGKHTYGVFVDFKKAYDKVCHGALYRVVSHLGIRGKFLEIIKWMYRHSAISVRMGGKTGDPFEMLRGTRQGCPLSPLLFILFINHILKDCSLGGVEVPGSPGTSRAHLNLPLRGKCKGSLYADDLILLEENLLRARGACEKLADWAKKWGMELGLQKCGVMLWSTSEEEIALYSDTEFDTPAGRIPQVDRYKYLGIWVDRSLVNHRSGPGEGEVSGLELQHSKAQAQKGERAVHQMRPLLTDRNCPLALKVDLIRNLIMPLMLYGSEWTAFRQTHAAPLQRVVNMAARWALGVFAKLTSFDGMTMCHALRIPSVEEEMVARRTRLQAKLEHGHPKMRTWLQILWGDDPHSYARARGNPYTWCKSGRTWVNRTLDANEGLTKYAGYRNITRPELAERAWELWEALRGWGDALNLETWHGPEYMSPREKLRDVMPLREWAARALIYESHVRSNDFRSVYIDQVRDLLVGLTPVGMIAEDEPTIEHRLARGLVDVEWHLPDERITWLEDQTGHTKNRSRREQTLVRDIRDCILERQFATMETKSFKWYDQWGFGATRDFTRAALQRPDLAEGVRWLTLVRIRGFPRAAAPVFASALFIEDTASVTSEHLEVAPTVDVDTEGEELLPPVFERRQRVLDSEHFARQEPSLPLDHDEISEDVLMDDEA
ncbi:hypothetical protein EUX98_g6712 [Antrodiella citrinella]|uniref:Reverse transcriptase domain-containing protein n=1 Tax=Antrodiella citrinella TaxID=2447956 RepID=A0A4S4MQC7_9APHY|nr:hypothetical protein EUX98_g6712 [Antrodiella citrinella]